MTLDSRKYSGRLPRRRVVLSGRAAVCKIPDLSLPELPPQYCTMDKTPPSLLPMDPIRRLTVYPS
jgi:hypothetical protein